MYSDQYIQLLLVLPTLSTISSAWFQTDHRSLHRFHPQTLSQRPSVLCSIYFPSFLLPPIFPKGIGVWQGRGRRMHPISPREQERLIDCSWVLIKNLYYNKSDECSVYIIIFFFLAKYIHFSLPSSCFGWMKGKMSIYDDMNIFMFVYYLTI